MQNGTLVESNFHSVVTPLMWPEASVNGNRQHYQQQWHFDALHQPFWGREEDNHTFITPDNSLLSYDSSANSGRLEFCFFTLKLLMSPLTKLTWFNLLTAHISQH